MEEIVEKDVNELQNKKKTFKTTMKKTLLGIISTALVFSTIPNISYQVALQKANDSSYIEEVLSTDQKKEDKIAQIFAEAIKKNNNIPDGLKNRIIESFTTQVIDRAGVFFTDETIRNMYAVASTERIKEMSSFAKEHGWWTGDYNSYTNRYSIDSTVGENDDSLIAHEQLHAILKKGMINTGVMRGLHGYGLNEGFTATFGKDDESYLGESDIVDVLGMLLGYNNVFQYYFNSDLSGLKKELNQYLSPVETYKLIHNIDVDVFSSYFQGFLEKNNIKYNEDKFIEHTKKRKLQNIEILEKIFENKYGVPYKESKFGQLIFNSIYFIDDEDYDPKKVNFSFAFFDDNNVKISLYSSSENGLASSIVNKKFDQPYGDVNAYFAKEFDLEGISAHEFMKINDEQTKVTIHGISCIVNIDDLETFDVEQFLNDVRTKLQTSQNIDVEEER